MKNRDLIDKLNKEHCLTRDEWVQIFATWDQYDLQYAARLAQCIALERFGRRIACGKRYDCRISRIFEDFPDRRWFERLHSVRKNIIHIDTTSFS